MLKNYMNKQEVTKKIALYIPSMNGGGAERVMLTLANALAEKDNISIDLVLNRAEGSYLNDVSAKVNIVNLNTSRVLKSVIPLSKYLKQEKPDTILSAMNYVNLIAIFAKLLSGTDTRVVVSEHGNLSGSLKNSKWVSKVVLKSLMSWTYKKSDFVVAVSDGVADDLSRQIKVNRNKVVTIYNPVVTEKLEMQKSEKIDHPLIRNNCSYIIGVGRLEPEKNFSLLINAFAKIHKAFDLYLVILGEGRLDQELKELINKLDLDDKIIMPGFSDNPYAWIKNSKCFVLSSEHEGLPTVLIESMACGTPVVSTDCPSGPNEILEEGKWGELVPVGDLELLSKAIIKVLSKPTKIDVRERAIFFSVQNSVDKYLEILIN